MPYTIDDAAPLLASLSFSKEELLAPYLLPSQGLDSYFQFTLWLFVHTLLRAATCDFASTTILPRFEPVELHKLRCWIRVLLWHLVCRAEHRKDHAMPRGFLEWSFIDYLVPAEAFFLLQMTSYLCQFVGYSSPPLVRDGTHTGILLSLIEAVSRRLHNSNGSGDYPEYSDNGRLMHAELLRSQTTRDNLWGPPVALRTAGFRLLTLPMGTMSFSLPLSPVPDDIEDTYDVIFGEIWASS
ncbi:hypothetical protein DFH07DRAFT_780848 [Mycena maculata]|uniref:Uncharacterized protein n=1 Tax=Mycena maculata TaxID=230809 RepID=A0AAD7I2L6_9AGAR|nr:hypothetical protein DFH07DRAFT_780848 [Mycena maculata]